MKQASSLFLQIGNVFKSLRCGDRNIVMAKAFCAQGDDYNKSVA